MSGLVYGLRIALCVTTRCALAVAFVLGAGLVAINSGGFIDSIAGGNLDVPFMGLFVLAGLVGVCGTVVGGVHMPTEEIRQNGGI